MQKNLVLKLLFLFVFVFFLYKSSSALLLPETPDGKIGKNYQLYGCFSSGLGISKGNFELSFFNNFGLRSNLGLDSIDFGLFYNTFATFMGLTTNFKYGFIRNQNLSSALDLSFSKPFTEGFLIKSGLAFNFTPFPFFEFIISSYYIYSFNEMHATENIVIPSGYGLYFFSGIEFIPPFAIDNTIALGCGYLYLPDNIPDSQRFFNQFYINMFVRYALNEPRVEKKAIFIF